MRIKRKRIRNTAMPVFSIFFLGQTEAPPSIIALKILRKTKEKSKGNQLKKKRKYGVVQVRFKWTRGKQTPCLYTVHTYTHFLDGQNISVGVGGGGGVCTVLLGLVFSVNYVTFLIISKNVVLRRHLLQAFSGMMYNFAFFPT